MGNPRSLDCDDALSEDSFLSDGDDDDDDGKTIDVVAQCTTDIDGLSLDGDAGEGEDVQMLASDESTPGEEEPKSAKRVKREEEEAVDLSSTSALVDIDVVILRAAADVSLDAEIHKSGRPVPWSNFKLMYQERHREEQYGDLTFELAQCIVTGDYLNKKDLRDSSRLRDPSIFM